MRQDYQAYLRIFMLHRNATRLYSDQTAHCMDAPSMMPAGSTLQDEAELDDGVEPVPTESMFEREPQ